MDTATVVDSNPTFVKKIATAIILEEKLSAADFVVGQNPDGSKQTVDSLALYKIAGIVRDVQAGEGEKGMWLALMGDFGSLCLYGKNKGKQLRSNKLFLPDVATNMLHMGLKATNGGSVQFAFDIGIKRDANSAVGYVYMVNPHVKPKEVDELTRLFQEQLTTTPATPLNALPPAEQEKGKGKK